MYLSPYPGTAYSTARVRNLVPFDNSVRVRFNSALLYVSKTLYVVPILDFCVCVRVVGVAVR